LRRLANQYARLGVSLRAQVSRYNEILAASAVWTGQSLDAALNFEKERDAVAVLAFIGRQKVDHEIELARRIAELERKTNFCGFSFKPAAMILNARRSLRTSGRRSQF
jgi:hypothetical protein